MRLAAAFLLAGLGPAAAATEPFAGAQSDYLMGCGGCHGIQGVSNSRVVPDLKDQAGYFLNTPEGRAYLVRLPNVAFDPISDDALAEMVNFVAFRLGGASVPAGAKPFDAAEVAALRRAPLTEDGLSSYRTRLIEDLITHFDASPKLRIYQETLYDHP